MSDFHKPILLGAPLHRLACIATATVGLAAVCASGAGAQAYDQPDSYAPPAYDDAAYAAPDIIVHAPRRQETDPYTGAPIEWTSASRVVRYGDLDLSRDWGVHELKVRIVRAAQDACDEIDNRSVVVNSDDTACVRSAVRHALYETPIGPRGE